MYYMRGVQHGSAVHPSRLHVYSPWVIQWLLPQASSEEEALQLVREERLPQLLTALNSLPTGPYRVEIMRVGEVDASGSIGNERTPYSTSIMQDFGPPVRALTDEEQAAFKARLNLVESSATVWAHARHYEEGLRLLDLRGGLPATMTAAAFTSFHRFVEGLVQARHRRVRLSEDDQRRQHTIIENLLESLNNRKRRGKHAAAVQEAARALTAVESYGFPRRLAAVVEGLNGSRELQQELQDFYSFRNKYFAHSGRDIDEELAREWSRRAAGACRELLGLWLVAEGGGVMPADRQVADVLAEGGQTYPVSLETLELD